MLLRVSYYSANHRHLESFTVLKIVVYSKWFMKMNECVYTCGSDFITNTRSDSKLSVVYICIGKRIISLKEAMSEYDIDHKRTDIDYSSILSEHFQRISSF